MSILLRRASPTASVVPSALPSPLEPAADSATIERLTDDPPFSYPDLRRHGIALTQALSGEFWTDYNYHDPGVTLLEALCYTITENVFGADAEIADLLTAPDGRIHYRRHALHGAEEALPCRPTTDLDLMRYLLDRVPAVHQLRLTMPGHDGLWRMALRVHDGDDAAAARDTARAYRAQRNLGEDIATLPQVLRPRWCALRIQMSVEGPRDLNDILVELVQRCARLVSAAPPRRPVQARLAQQDAFGRPLGTSRLFEGPSLQCGWIAEEDLRRDTGDGPGRRDSRLYFSDLARALREIEGIADISDLRLVLQDTGDSEGDSEGGGDDSTDSLQWQGDDWALQLRWPETEAALSGWTITRRGSRFHLDTRELLAQLADARQAARVASVPPRTRAYAGQLLPRPSGHYVPEIPYLSTWHHLPPLYREAHSAPLADADREAQFGAYLALLEQWMAHGNAQLQHLRELFSLTPQPSSSYWWEPLGPTQVPGLAGVCAEPTDAAARSLAAGDDALARRSRVLDLLLALHGEHCDQHSIQRFGYYFDAAGWQAHLYECKRRFVQRIVRHTRDRAGAFDYSRPSLGRRGNTAPLQERIGLLLGFTQTHSRLLAGGLAALGMRIDDGHAHVRRHVAEPPADLEALTMAAPLRARIAAHYAEDTALDQVADRLAFYFTDLAPRRWPGALLRCAAHGGRYHQGSGADGTLQLWLGPDEHGGWWPLAVREGPGGVLAPALYLHEFACRLQRESEGLHLVEHILLRPLGDARAAADVPADFYAHRLSVILPGWTARGADQSFRDLAEETVALGCPAHILPHVHWLDAAELAAFERDFERWLRARQAQANAPDDAAAVAHLDTCAAALRHRLSAPPRGGAR